jgi:diaminopropionate ammonia-lyase
MAMKWNWNRFREPGQGAAQDSEACGFHRGMAAYRVTPLVACPRAAAALGIGALWVKDESARFGLNAFKSLGASWAMSRIARERGAVPDFAAATDGNHGRAVAWMARRMGARAHIFVPRNTPPARRALIQGEGARVHVIEGSYDDAVRACAAESAACGWQVVADTGYDGYLKIPRWVVEGYGTLFAEYAEQEVEPPDVVFVQGGVGGLLCAAIRHFSSGPKIVSVEPLDADCLRESIASPDGEPRTAKGSQNSIMHGLNCGEVSLTAWPEIRRGADLFLAIEDELATEAMELLAPMDSGESGAAGVAGLIAVCREPSLRGELGIGPQTRVFAINTEARLQATA